MMLTERDKNILNFIGKKYGFALTSHVTTFFFPQKKVASRRLNMLVKNGYLSRFERPSCEKGRAEFVFTITQKTRKLIPDSEIPALKEMSHTICLNDFIEVMHRAVRQKNFKFYWEKDSFLRGEDRFAKYLKLNSPSSKIMFPDIAFCLENSNQKKLLFLVEVERQTISIDSNRGTSLKDKIITMANYFDTGCYQFFNDVFDADFKGFRYLVVSTGGTTRLNNIANTLNADQQDFGFVWLAKMEDVTSERVFQNIWRKIGNADLHSII